MKAWKPSSAPISGVPTRRMILSALLAEVFELPAHGALGLESKEAGRQQMKRWRDGKLADDRAGAIEDAVIGAILGFDRNGDFHEAAGSDGEAMAPFDRRSLATALRAMLDDSERIAGLLREDFCGHSARRAWLEGFVTTRLAHGLCEAIRRHPGLDSGMPRGVHWYLPRMRVFPTLGNGVSFEWDDLPCRQVLRWWEDLLGSPLEGSAKRINDRGAPDFLEMVFGKEFDRKTAREEILDWKSGERPVSWQKIHRWTADSVKWPYAGVFVDKPGASLAERWRRCRGFLDVKSKRRSASAIPSDWLARPGATGTPELLKTQYTSGHWLELELPVFSDPRIPISRFIGDGAFDAAPEGMSQSDWHDHVADFISRVAARWAAPSNAVVRQRLLIASAAQRAVRALHKFDPECAGVAVAWFNDAYNLLMGSANDCRGRPEEGAAQIASRLTYIRNMDATVELKRLLSSVLCGASGDPDLIPVLRHFAGTYSEDSGG